MTTDPILTMDTEGNPTWLHCPLCGYETPDYDELWLHYTVHDHAEGPQIHQEPRLKAIGVVRVSTREQLNGDGLAAQEKAIRAWCGREGITLVSIERDEAVSGTKGLDARSGLACALARIEAKEADMLVVDKIDRLARDLVMQETICAKVRVATVFADVDGDDPTRVLLRQMLGAIAQYERALIRARLHAGKAVKAARGGYTGGAPPYGWRAPGQGRDLVPYPEELGVIDLMLGMYAEGESMNGIARRLTTAGRLTRKGTPWHDQTVARIIRRETA